MEALNTEEIKKLTQPDIVSPAVTIYAPMHRTASAKLADKIRLKNLFHDAIHELEGRPVGAQLAKELKAKAKQLLSDREFWENQTEGLLICANPDFIKLFQLPVDTAEHVSVAQFFHLAPIFSLLADQQSFLTLVLAQHNPQLHQADMYSLKPLNIGLPTSLEAALGIDELNQGNHQGRSDSGRDGDTANFNGRGGARDPREEERLRFFRMIDEKIMEQTDRSLPLMIAGVESEINEYKALSKYPHIIEESLTGNFADVPTNRLFDQALQVFRRSAVMHEHDAILDRYARVHGSSPQLAAEDDITAAQAAADGRVDTLVVGMSRFTTDSVRDTMQPTTVLEFEGDNKDELINQTAQLVWSSGGRVVNIETEKLPLNVHMHAILRY